MYERRNFSGGGGEGRFKGSFVRSVLPWWTGGLPHLSVLAHLLGVPHLHVNRPLMTTYLQGIMTNFGCVRDRSSVFCSHFLKKWLICQSPDCMYLCGSLALPVRMCVPGVNKVPWVYALEPMRIWHLNMTLLKVKQGHFETAILILYNFFFFYDG